MTNFERAVKAQTLGDTMKFMRFMVLHMQEQDRRILAIENRQQGLSSFADDLGEEDNFGPVRTPEDADGMLQGMNKAVSVVVREGGV